MAKKLTPKQQAVALAMGQYRKERMEQITTNLVPCVYSALAIALHKRGWGYKRINDLFVDSQEIWQEYCFDEKNMMETCEQLTGICVDNIANERH